MTVVAKAQRFITFEGGEGTGKSTQARRLADRLRELGHDVFLTREPGGSPLAERIRELVLVGKPASPMAEFLLFAAARADHVAATIAPILAAGCWVISDRFIDSTRVYQGHLSGIDPVLMTDLERRTVGPYRPRLTLVLDMPPAESLARIASRGGDMNRFDSGGLDVHEALRRGFLDIARDDPRRCVIIPAAGDEGAVAARVWMAVSARLPVEVPVDSPIPPPVKPPSNPSGEGV